IFQRVCIRGAAMRFRLMSVVCAGLLLLLMTVPCPAAEPEPRTEPLTFQRAIELALKNSGAVAIADLEQQRAERGYSEARAAYTPQLSAGAGLGYSYGFPLSIEGSAPTLFNFSSQQALWNPAQRDYIRAAKMDVSAST